MKCRECKKKIGFFASLFVWLETCRSCEIKKHEEFDKTVEDYVLVRKEVITQMKEKVFKEIHYDYLDYFAHGMEPPRKLYDRLKKLHAELLEECPGKYGGIVFK